MLAGQRPISSANPVLCGTGIRSSARRAKLGKLESFGFGKTAAEEVTSMPSHSSNARPRRHPKRWVAKVKTDSTHPPEGLFKKSAAAIARTLASKKVSPKGPGSGMRMLTYYINRAGRGLSASRRKELDRAKVLLSDRIHRENKRNKKAA